MQFENFQEVLESIANNQAIPLHQLLSFADLVPQDCIKQAIKANPHKDNFLRALIQKLDGNDSQEIAAAIRILFQIVENDTIASKIFNVTNLKQIWKLIFYVLSTPSLPTSQYTNVLCLFHDILASYTDECGRLYEDTPTFISSIIENLESSLSSLLFFLITLLEKRFHLSDLIPLIDSKSLFATCIERIVRQLKNLFISQHDGDNIPALIGNVNESIDFLVCFHEACAHFYHEMGRENESSTKKELVNKLTNSIFWILSENPNVLLLKTGDIHEGFLKLLELTFHFAEDSLFEKTALMDIISVDKIASFGSSAYAQEWSDEVRICSLRIFDYFGLCTENVEDELIANVFHSSIHPFSLDSAHHFSKKSADWIKILSTLNRSIAEKTVVNYSEKLSALEIELYSAKMNNKKEYEFRETIANEKLAVQDRMLKEAHAIISSNSTQISKINSEKNDLKNQVSKFQEVIRETNAANVRKLGKLEKLLKEKDEEIEILKKENLENENLMSSLANNLLKKKRAATNKRAVKEKNSTPDISERMVEMSL